MSIKSAQLHLRVTATHRAMLAALCELRGQTTNEMIQTLIHDTCYGKTLNAAERKHLWQLIEKGQQR